MVLEDIVFQNKGVPLYVQLRDQIAASIGRGALMPGTQLPTMRQVAVALKIDLNTVQRAYNELEREGLLRMVQGSGSFVAHPPALRHRGSELNTFAARVAAQAQARGIALGELIEALHAVDAARAP
jgi:GntR family transcriptional regulator